MNPSQTFPRLHEIFQSGEKEGLLKELESHGVRCLGSDVGEALASLVQDTDARDDDSRFIALLPEDLRNRVENANLEGDWSGDVVRTARTLGRTILSCIEHDIEITRWGWIENISTITNIDSAVDWLGKVVSGRIEEKSDADRTQDKDINEEVSDENAHFLVNPYSFLFKITGKERIKRHFERLGIHRNMQIPYERVFLDDYDEERVLVSLVPITLQKEYARLQNTDESESTRSMLIKELGRSILTSIWMNTPLSDDLFGEKEWPDAHIRKMMKDIWRIIKESGTLDANMLDYRKRLGTAFYKHYKNKREKSETRYKFLRKSWDYGQFSGEDLLKVANLWDRLLDHSAQKKEVRDAWQFLVDQEVSFEEIIVPEEGGSDGWYDSYISRFLDKVDDEIGLTTGVADYSEGDLEDEGPYVEDGRSEMQPESNLVEDESGLIRRLCDYAPDGFWDEYGDETHWVTHLAGESTREQLDSNTQHGEWLFTLYLCGLRELTTNDRLDALDRDHIRDDLKQLGRTVRYHLTTIDMMQEDLCEDEELLNQSLWIDKMTHIKEASFDSLTRQTSPGESNSDPEEKYYMKIGRDMIDGVFDQMLRDAEGATSQKKLDDIKLDGNRTLADLQLLILSGNEKITRHIEVLMSNMTNMNEGSS